MLPLDCTCMDCSLNCSLKQYSGVHMYPPRGRKTRGMWKNIKCQSDSPRLPSSSSICYCRAQRPLPLLSIRRLVLGPPQVLQFSLQSRCILTQVDPENPEGIMSCVLGKELCLISSIHPQKGKLLTEQVFSKCLRRSWSSVALLIFSLSSVSISHSNSLSSTPNTSLYLPTKGVLAAFPIGVYELILKKVVTAFPELALKFFQVRTVCLKVEGKVHALCSLWSH